jgi:multidrug efflux pump subunit AcrB
VRTVSIYGEVNRDQTNVNEVLMDTQKRFFPQIKERFPGVEVTLEGEIKEGGTTQASMGRAFLMGLIGIFILLSFQFRSYIEPIIVMVVIPLSFIGVVWGHLIMGQDLSMPSMMGFISLAGVVVNDSILLVEFVKLRAREGLAVHDAACQASRDRFRAVLLTSLTTIAGLLPILSEKSLQAQVLIPLVTSVVFGISASTLLVLFVIPALYAILEDFGLTKAV